MSTRTDAIRHRVEGRIRQVAARLAGRLDVDLEQLRGRGEAALRQVGRQTERLAHQDMVPLPSAVRQTLERIGGLCDAVAGADADAYAEFPLDEAAPPAHAAAHSSAAPMAAAPRPHVAAPAHVAHPAPPVHNAVASPMGEAEPQGHAAPRREPGSSPRRRGRRQPKGERPQ